MGTFKVSFEVFNAARSILSMWHDLPLHAKCKHAAPSPLLWHLSSASAFGRREGEGERERERVCVCTGGRKVFLAGTYIITYERERESDKETHTTHTYTDIDITRTRARAYTHNT